MPPSFPHAVFTPDPALVVGGQFYTAANLGRTVHGVALQERAPAVSNEDLAANTYETLAWLLDHCDAFLDAPGMARVRAHALSFFRARDIHGDGAVGGPQPTRSQLKKRAERLGLQTRVNMPTAELAELLRNQDPEKEHAEGWAGAGRDGTGFSEGSDGLFKACHACSGVMVGWTAQYGVGCRLEWRSLVSNAFSMFHTVATVLLHTIALSVDRVMQ